MLRKHAAGAVVALAIAFVGTLGLRSAGASLIWDGDASKGTGVFKLVGSNCSSPGSVTAVNDSSMGRVFRFYKPSGSDRCESHGCKNVTFRSGSTYYLGWRTKLSNTVNNNANFQWKVWPAPGPAGLNWPLALKMINGRATLLNRKATNEVYTIWSAPFSANTWYQYALGVKVSNVRDGGWVQLWFRGVRQTFSNGSQTWACRLYDVNEVGPKWGVYGASGSTVINYVDGLKVGTTYADVAQ